MRSRTSRGVPEWSGGKDLYIGSPVSAIGTSFGVIGIVPGPPEGSRGPTGWGHLPRGATWAVGCAPWPIWAKGTSPKRPMRQGNLGREESSRGKAPPRCLGEDGLLPPLAAPFLGGRGKAAPPPSPLPLYIVEGREGIHTRSLGASLPPVTPPPLPQVLDEALQNCHAPPSPPRRRAAAGWSLPQPLPISLLDQGMGDVTGLYVC